MLILKIIKVLHLVDVFGVRRFDPSKGNFLDASAREMDFHASLRVGLNSKRALVGLSQRRVHAPPTDHHVSRGFQIFGDVDVRNVVCRRLFGLEALYFKAEVGQGVLALAVEIGREGWEEIARDRESFAVD